MKHSYNKFYVKGLQDEIDILTDKVKSLKKENNKMKRIIKASNIPFELPDDYYESDDYKV